MPATAKGLGVDINNPEQNAVGGALYLRQLVDRYNGNVAMALAAYNWGPGNVDRVKGNLAAMPVETQNYVRGILAQVTGGR